MDEENDRLARDQVLELRVGGVPSLPVGSEPCVVIHPVERKPIRLVHQVEPLKLEFGKRNAMPADLDLIEVNELWRGRAVASEQILARRPENVTPARAMSSDPANVESAGS
jgi:hypothetical protein